MVTFFPPNDAFYESLPRGHAVKQLPYLQRRQHFGLPFDCPRVCAALDNSPSFQFPAVPSDEAMQSDTWGLDLQLTPKPGHPSHQRQSSLFSIGSAEPASPFASHMSNPQIAVTDPTVDSFADLHSTDNSASPASAFYPFHKSLNSYIDFQNPEIAVPDKMAYPVTMTGPTQKSRVDRSLLPTPASANFGNRSRPASVTSSAAGDSPATPTTGEPGYVDRRRNRGHLPLKEAGPDSPAVTVRSEYCNVPKLSRTMTDVYGDELYNPDFTITSTSPSQAQTLTSPTNDVFSQRINAANSHHLSAAHSPSSTASRTRSPFRTGSPFVSSSVSHTSLAAFNNTMRRAVERAEVQQANSPTEQQCEAGLKAEATVETPRTISPKDAMLEFGETDGNANFPLFPPDASALAMEPMPKRTDGYASDDPYTESDDYRATSNASLLPIQMSPNSQASQQYAFASEFKSTQPSSIPLSPSVSSTAALSRGTPTVTQKPRGAAADGGTYTCTYHGCTLRFETPSLLQKHKREGHRQTQGLAGPREASISSGMLNTQSGPHRCDRINPSTGKSCNTIFSRPYDLTRHEDTIHNARKQKVRCDMCSEEKMFSRADALTRHYRVCHPEVELPGKHMNLPDPPRISVKSPWKRKGRPNQA